MIKQYIWYRLLGIALVIPNAVREWIDTLTDIASYQGNMAQIINITSYKSTLVQTVFDRSFTSSWIAYIGAAGFVLMHLVLAILMTIGIIVMLKNLQCQQGKFRPYIFFAIIGLGLTIVSYFFFFGVMAMDYFLSQLHGLNYCIEIITVSLPAGIALLYLPTLE